DDVIRDRSVTGVQTCALPISDRRSGPACHLREHLRAERASAGEPRRRARCRTDRADSESGSWFLLHGSGRPRTDDGQGNGPRVVSPTADVAGVNPRDGRGCPPGVASTLAPGAVEARDSDHRAAARAQPSIVTKSMSSSMRPESEGSTSAYERTVARI